MIFLQIEEGLTLANNLTDKIFNVDPTTIYGLMLLILTLIIALLVYAVIRLWKAIYSVLKEKDNQILELNKSTIDVLRDLEKILDTVHYASDKNAAQLLAAISEAKQDISYKILLLDVNMKKNKLNNDE